MNAVEALKNHPKDVPLISNETFQLKITPNNEVCEIRGACLVAQMALGAGYDPCDRFPLLATESTQDDSYYDYDNWEWVPQWGETEIIEPDASEWLEDAVAYLREIGINLDEIVPIEAVPAEQQEWYSHYGIYRTGLPMQSFLVNCDDEFGWDIDRTIVWLTQFYENKVEA